MGQVLAQVEANGITVAYRLDGPRNAPTVILSAGLAMDLSMWEPQIEALETRFQVLRYDARGHGGTSATPGDYSLDGLADDVMALMDALGIRQAYVVGTSLGAMIGQAFALRAPERCLGLVLCATTSTPVREGWDARIASIRSNGIAPHVDPIVAQWFTPPFAAAHPAVLQTMRTMVLATPLDGFLSCATAIRDMTLAERIGAIRAPTLVLAGSDDLATPLTHLDFIARTIPNAELVSIAQSAHMPTIERPAACNTAILAFLDRAARPDRR